MTDQERQMELLYPFSDDTMFRDEDGSRLPWYTPGAIEWIKKNIASNVSVLEFGGGHSTLWWRKRSPEVTTIEYNNKCCEILAIQQDSPKNFFDFVEADRPYLSKYGIKAFSPVDVVIVDSEAEMPRNEYILKAFDLCKKYFIVDNWQQPDVCIYDEATVKFLYDNTKEQHIFPYPHNGWQTAIFVK